MPAKNNARPGHFVNRRIVVHPVHAELPRARRAANKRIDFAIVVVTKVAVATRCLYVNSRIRTLFLSARAQNTTRGAS